MKFITALALLGAVSAQDLWAGYTVSPEQNVTLTDMTTTSQFGVLFWKSMTGPTKADAKTNQTVIQFRLKVNSKGTGLSMD